MSSIRGTSPFRIKVSISRLHVYIVFSRPSTIGKSLTGDHGHLLVLLQHGLRLLVSSDGELSSAVVHEEAAGTPDVDRVPDLHVLEVLGHLAAVGEPRVDVFKVNLNIKVQYRI